MMTSVLRDSLGGNCRTVMVATCSAERDQTEESISTCRFAQRVALVKNDATVNEETDPRAGIRRGIRNVDRRLEDARACAWPVRRLDFGHDQTQAMIKRLKGEVTALRAEVAYLKGEAGEGDALTDGERASLASACEVRRAERGIEFAAFFEDDDAKSSGDVRRLNCRRPRRSTSRRATRAKTSRSRP